MRVLLTTLHSKFIHASLALPYLAGYCADLGIEIKIAEFTVHEPRESILAAILEQQADVVAFSVYLWNRRETLDLVDALSVVRPELRLVLGGPETSFESEKLFEQHPGLTAVICGEGEIPLHGLLKAWSEQRTPQGVPRLLWREGGTVQVGPDGPPLANLDRIPSPFAAGLVDMERGFVYYETSRGCPYRCSFCMSALDQSVRSFSMQRIRSDLGLLMEQRVPKIKLVDRTFNYDAQRSREIFSFILEHNRGSHFHFEIGAHLLDDATLDLLENVPDEMFQFEIGVQSTLDDTLARIARQTSLERLSANVRRLRRCGNIHLHLDLIAGLPGENYSDFLASIDRVLEMNPHHLQIEPVKLLPGAPLRQQASQWQLAFDPNPPYTVLQTPDMSHLELQRLQGISRLLDLTFNCGRCSGFLEGVAEETGSMAKGLEWVEGYWRQQGVFRYPLSQRGVFEQLAAFIEGEMDPAAQARLQELLARDFALSERVVPNNHPSFFDTQLTEKEEAWVRDQVQQCTQEKRGSGVKVQFFCAVFRHLTAPPQREVRLFLYLTATGKGLQVKELILPSKID